MKKNITKEQIIETALELMRNKNNLRGLNLREIARVLGCAHTNLYNYFSSYSDLLWAAHASLQEKFMGLLSEKLKTANNAKLRLDVFFRTFVDIYMDNKGWFRLAWIEYISDEQPLQATEVTKKSNRELNELISEIWKELTGVHPDAEKTRRVLHNTHCYIVGEVSNYLLGRGLIKNETELKAYITREAIRMFRLCLSGE